MSFLSYAGDALWVAALFVMLVAGRNAWDRMDAATQVPMKFATDGRPVWRAPRRWALFALPGVAFFMSLVLIVTNRNARAAPEYALILFGVRALLAAMFALAYLRWLKAAMEVLEQEGALKPPRPAA